MKYEGLVTAKKNGDIYAYHGEQKFTNLSRGGKGKLSKEDSIKLFNIPITLNLFAERNPCVVSLIEKLGMSLEPYTEEEKINIEKSLENKK